MAQAVALYGAHPHSTLEVGRSMFDVHFFSKEFCEKLGEQSVCDPKPSLIMVPFTRFVDSVRIIAGFFCTFKTVGLQESPEINLIMKTWEWYVPKDVKHRIGYIILSA
jgi:hypothetical protein